MLAGVSGWMLHPLLGAGRSEPKIAAHGAEGSWTAVLQSALETAPSGASVSIGNPDRAEGSVKVVSTFRSQDQRYCRQYAVQIDRTYVFDGLACRTAQAGWLVEHQMRRPLQADGRPGLRPAAGRPRQGLDLTVDELIDGGVLDPDEERKLLKSRWSATPRDH
jgi:hypothetical protein